MKRTIKSILAIGIALVGGINGTEAQSVAGDSVMQHVKGNRLSVGGYGEVAYSRNFYSDNTYRYTRAKRYKDDPSHGRFDIPHAVIYLGYDFGKGWTMGTEIEFEHTGSGCAVEQEYEEGAEWEQEVEKGGEVELEQFWLQKSFARWANIRMGHIVVPVGLNNAYHEPLNFFTVYRPEGENTVLPSTWHDTGISFWGRAGDWRYEVQMVAGLDAMKFDRDGWVHNGAKSAFEFKVANKYGFSGRVDNYTLPGLRIGLSGYYGQAFHNTFPHDMEGKGTAYEKLKGKVYIGSVDFTFNRYNWIVRGQADMGYLSDAPQIFLAKYTAARKSNAPYSEGEVASHAYAVGIEAGYNIFSQIAKLRDDNQKLYLFGRYDNYNPYVPSAGQSANNYTKKQRMAFGVNYYPLPQIAIKAEYSKRFLKKGYNNEPSISLGIAYEGFFL